VLSDIGGVKVKDPSPKVFDETEKLDSVGFFLLTVSLVVIVLELKLDVWACVIVIFAMPAPTIVTVLLDNVATAVLELAKLKAPVLLDVGISAKAVSPNVFDGIVKLTFGFALTT
jgi:hypothetical protein